MGNAAITLFNTYLPQMRQHNYAALSGVLQQAQAGLLQLQPAEIDPALLISLTCSMAAAVEHSSLLAVLTAAGKGLASVEEGGEQCCMSQCCIPETRGDEGGGGGGEGRECSMSHDKQMLPVHAGSSLFRV